MTKNQCIPKMNSILQDSSKFATLCSTADFENAPDIESQIQRRLLQLKKDGFSRPKTGNKI